MNVFPSRLGNLTRSYPTLKWCFAPPIFNFIYDICYFIFYFWFYIFLVLFFIFYILHFILHISDSIFHISTSSYSSMILLHSELMHCISPPFLPMHFPSLCSPLDPLFAQKNPANWPIFKFYISNVFLSKFYFPAPCSAYFQLGTGKQENSYFNWILLNIFFSGLSARCASQTKPISVHFLLRTHLGQEFFTLYWILYSLFMYHASCIYAYIMKTILCSLWEYLNHKIWKYLLTWFRWQNEEFKYLLSKIGSIVLIHC